MHVRLERKALPAAVRPTCCSGPRATASTGTAGACNGSTVGTGIATPFHTFAVGGPAELAALLTWPDDTSLPDRTTLLDLPGDPDRPAAVAVLARGVRVSEHDGSRVLSG